MNEASPSELGIAGHIVHYRDDAQMRILFFILSEEFTLFDVYKETSVSHGDRVTAHVI